MQVDENHNHQVRGHRVEVSLALLATNIVKPSETAFLIHRESLSLPTSPLAFGQDTLEVAEMLLKLLTGTGPTWLPLQQVCTLSGRQDGKVVVLYSILMPEKAPLFNKMVEWVDFATISQNPELLKLFAYSCNAYRIGVPQ